MEVKPYNEKLHQYLMQKGYKWKWKVRHDRYDLNGRTIFYYMHGYMVIVEADGEPASKEIFDKIKKQT